MDRTSRLFIVVFQWCIQQRKGLFYHRRRRRRRRRYSERWPLSKSIVGINLSALRKGLDETIPNKKTYSEADAIDQ